MRFRNSRLRTKITALLLSLTALWVFAAWVTLREGVNLLSVSTLDRTLAEPTDPLLAELQRERRLSMIQLTKPSGPARSALRAQRAKTDETLDEAVRLAQSDNVGRFGSAALERRVDEMLRRLRSVDSTRRIVDGGAVDRNRVAAAYAEIIQSIFRVYDSLATLDDKDFARDTRNLLELNRMWELLSQEDAMMAGSLVSGRISEAELITFTQTVGTRRHNTERMLVVVQSTDRELYDRLTQNKNLRQVQAYEDEIMKSRARPTAGNRGAAARPPVTFEQWTAATEPALAEMRDSIQSSGNRLVDRAKPIAAGVILRLLLAGGLGLLAVIASIIVSITTARALVRQLERLRDAAMDLAEQRLPSVVERLGHGEKVDVAVEAPPLRFGTDEIGQVGRAFNVVQETAIRTAVEQAELRRGVRDVLLSLARRTQALVHRQLAMLDKMERRRDIEVKELEELFRLDHLATRMRRNAENLIVLSGALPARGWQRPVPMVDVIRAAVGEVEDYTRVTVTPFSPVRLVGRAVGDVTHLLAELIENAVSFSPPDTVVQVGGHLVASGFAIDIEDRGLGMTDEKLAEINERIANPPDFNLQSSVQLGLFVVSKLAERYNVQVSLKRSAYGGTTAVVLIPRELISEGEGPDAPQGAKGARTADGRPAGAAAGNGHAQAAGNGHAQAAGGGQDRAPALVAVPDLSPGASAEQEAPSSTATATASAGPSAGAAAGAGEPESAPARPQMDSTPSGLPVRVPQASLAEPLRTDEPVVAEKQEKPEDRGRSPEEIQRIFGAYQRGSRKGRSDAAARATGEHDRPGGPEAEAETAAADEAAETEGERDEEQ